VSRLGRAWDRRSSRFWGLLETALTWAAAFVLLTLDNPWVGLPLALVAGICGGVALGTARDEGRADAHPYRASLSALARRFIVRPENYVSSFHVDGAPTATLYLDGELEVSGEELALVSKVRSEALGSQP
jgi:hypothetical protein